MGFSHGLLLAATLGVLAHQCIFIFGEWHMQAGAVLVTHLVSYGGVWTSLRLSIQAPALVALWKVTALASCYLFGLFGSILIYRLFFHRCRGFDGPLLARATKIWHAWNSRDSQNHLLLDRIHQQYGDFVRTGPAEITIYDADCFQTVFGSGTKCTRSVWYDLMKPNYSIISSRDQKIHDERRRVWSPAFGAKALKSYEPRVLENVAKLDGLIEKAAIAGRPVDVTNLCYWFAFDVMGEFAFAESFGMLDNEAYHKVIVLFRNAMHMLGPLSPVLWLTRGTMSLMPGVWRVGDWNKWFAYCHEQMAKRVQMKPTKPDISTYLIKDAEANGFTDSDKKFLNGDAVTVIIGGSDSSAPTLTFCLYNLARYPEHAEQVFRELSGVDVEDAEVLKNLPHLSAIIEETLRLYPALPTSVQRETPPEGITVAGRFIPGNTTLVMPRYTIGRRELYFEKADRFIPERWTTRPELVKEKMAHQPFSLGKSNCIGKNLALMDIKLVLSRVVSKYHLSFVPGTNPHLVHELMQDHFTVAPGPLQLMFTQR